MRLHLPVGITLLVASLAACKTDLATGPVGPGGPTPNPSLSPSAPPPTGTQAQASAGPIGPVASASVPGGVSASAAAPTSGGWSGPPAPAQEPLQAIGVGPRTVEVGRSQDLPSWMDGAAVVWSLADASASEARLEGGPGDTPQGPATDAAASDAGASASASGGLSPIAMPAWTPPPPYRLVALAPGAVALKATHRGRSAYVQCALVDPAVGNTWLETQYGARWRWSDKPIVVRDQATLDRLYADGWYAPQGYRLQQSVPGPVPSAPTPGGMASPTMGSTSAPNADPTSAPPPPPAPRVAFPTRHVLILPLPAGAGGAVLVRVQGLKVQAVVPEVRYPSDLPPAYSPSPCPVPSGWPMAWVEPTHVRRMAAFVVPALPAGEVDFTLLPFAQRELLPYASPTPAKCPPLGE